MILAILQARTTSTRLPGKVLKPILGKPMLSLEIERVLRSRRIDRLVIATSIDKGDDEIEALCNDLQILCFRGSLDDVLDRFYKAALQCRPEYVVRLTGDCPLIDPKVIDEVVDFLIKGGFDYAANCLEPLTFPDGLDVEILRFSALETAWREAVLPSHREHVTPFIRQNLERFKIGYYKNNVDLSHLRWTVDEQEDFYLVTRIYKALYTRNPEFTTNDILNILEENPDLKTMNTSYKRNEGYRKSLMEDVLQNKGK